MAPNDESSWLGKAVKEVEGDLEPSTIPIGGGNRQERLEAHKGSRWFVNTQNGDLTGGPNGVG